MIDRVKLVWMQVGDLASASPAAYGMLDACECERAERYKVELPRRVFVAARALLRSTLGAELGVDPRSLEFSIGPHGKPRLEPASHLEFNLAHSGTTIVIALAEGTSVGVDVEEAAHEVPALRLAGRFFTEAEAAAVAEACETARLRVFHHLWTAKEAVLKATGSGLTVPVREVELDPNPDSPPTVRAIAGDRDAAKRWRLLRHEQPGEWIATVAFKGRRRDLEVTEATPPDALRP